jgi:hypothetical protein
MCVCVCVCVCAYIHANREGRFCCAVHAWLLSCCNSPLLVPSALHHKLSHGACVVFAMTEMWCPLSCEVLSQYIV